MTAYNTKEELENAYVDHLELGGIERSIAKIMAKGKAVYVPHLYRGGWVVRQFGFSIERIGTCITLERAGDPEIV